MIGTVIPKPIVDQEQFRAVMSWCCDQANNARMMEYKDRYEIAERLAEEPKRAGEEPEFVPEPSIEERLDRIEKALAELQGGAKK